MLLCADCGREIPISKPQKTLCIPCKYLAVRAKYKAKRDANKIKKEPVICSCTACEQKFERRTKDQIYCNDECRIIMDNKKFNKRWAEEESPIKKRQYPKQRKQFDISKNYFTMKKFNTIRG